MAIKIIMHALSMVFRDFWQSVRVTAPFYLAANFVFVLPVIVFVGPSAFELYGPLEPNLDGQGIGFWLAYVLGSIIGVILYSWAAVAWHRYALLGVIEHEYPVGKIGPYFFKGLGYALLAVIPALIITLFVSPLLGSALLTQGQGFSVFFFWGSLVSGIGTFAMIYILLRISIGLPGLSVDFPMTLTESWSQTSTLSGSIFGIAAIGAFVSQGGTMVSNALLSDLDVPIQMLFVFVLDWLQFVVPLSVLTTLYGVIVEKRELR